MSKQQKPTNADRRREQPNAIASDAIHSHGDQFANTDDNLPNDPRVSKDAITLPALWRWVLSLLILLQLLAVWVEPFRFFTLSSRGTSPASDLPRNVLAPYVEFAYLNHGYFFFAPEPGPSHLIEAQLTDGDGRKSMLRYPDRNAQWPRLLYHRHFMLTENLHQLWFEPFEEVSSEVPLTDEDRAFLAEWQASRQRYEMIRDSMAGHLADRFDAETVELQRIEHRLPSDVEVFDQRMRLNDRRLYIPLPDSLPPASPPGMMQPNTLQPGMSQLDLNLDWMTGDGANNPESKAPTDRESVTDADAAEQPIELQPSSENALESSDREQQP